MKLTRKNIQQITGSDILVPHQQMFYLPEKVLQFGTGVLSRGIADYFIDKANYHGIFNGRIVMVNSNLYGHTSSFQEQDYLFTQISSGLENGEKVEEKRINASLSRVLYSKEQWDEILECATNPELQVIIADTTEVNIALDEQDSIHALPPATFPCKLLAFLYKRFTHFNGDASKGMVIIPTELVPENGMRLEAIMLELAHSNEMEAGFMDWLETANHFCNSLVDRVIPSLNKAQKAALEKELGYRDDLLVMSESFCSWAIETCDPAVAEILSFSKVGTGVILMPDIEVFRELKLRLLNGTHTFACGLAFLAGIETVKDAKEHPAMSAYIQQMMTQELAPAIPYYIEQPQIDAYIKHVLDRFSNPFIEHHWLTICLQFSSKMKVRNLEVLLQHYSKSQQVPERMALGFAAHILFMTCAEEAGRFYGFANGKKYLVQDDKAPIYAAAWKKKSNEAVVHSILAEPKLWEVDLSTLPGFEAAVIGYINTLQQGEVITALQALDNQKQVA